MGVNGSFRLSQALAENPNFFIRNYARLKYGNKYISSHVFDVDNNKSTRIPAEDYVVEDLKSESKIERSSTFMIDKLGFLHKGTGNS